MRWDPEQYLRFADERSRPFHDLLAQVGARDPGTVVDLGCGPGHLTRTLAERWPGARVEGVDASAEMIDRARSAGTSGSGDGGRPGSGGLPGPDVTFTLGDLRTWDPPRPVDVLVSNATLQWVPGHLELLDRLVARVAPGGWLAFQVPANFAAPTHTELAALRDSPRWRERLAGADLPRAGVEEPVAYLARLTRLGLDVRAWETTYLQVLPGEDPVLEWMRGTGLRPVVQALGEGEREEFEAEYGRRLRAAYPRQDIGTVLPYRRIFVVGRRPG